MRPTAWHGVWRLNDTADAQRAAQLAEAGDLIGLSIGFQPIRSDWELVDDWDPDLGLDHKDRVTRLESRLLEVSMTPTPAFQEAKVTLVREQSVYTRRRRGPCCSARPTPNGGGARSTNFGRTYDVERSRRRELRTGHD